jgi:O-phosphoseryl-tRNA(Cys) synthetase
MVVNVNGQQVRVKVVESSDENVLLEGEAILNNIPVQDEI